MRKTDEKQKTPMRLTLTTTTIRDLGPRRARGRRRRLELADDLVREAVRLDERPEVLVRSVS